MSESRCQECGSWDRECSSPTPVQGCGCARCLSATLVARTKERDEAQEERFEAKLSRERERKRADAAEEEIERLNGVLVKMHLHVERLTEAYLSACDVARHNYEEAERSMNTACAWAFDLGSKGVACYWCKTNLGNDFDAIRKHTRECMARAAPLASEVKP